jgi:hypothetical protein
VQALGAREAPTYVIRNAGAALGALASSGASNSVHTARLVHSHAPSVCMPSRIAGRDCT